jgi:riboflavin biosynthesis pyrimidine reductase
MILTEVVPRTLESADVSTDAGRAWLRDRYRRTDDAYVRLNMVTSLTGAAWGPDGTSDTLTSRIDRRVLGVIRAEADVVLVGAQSVRAEGYVVPRAARLAVVTASGDLEGHRLVPGEDAVPDRVLVLCSEHVAERLSEREPVHGPQVVPVPGPDRLTPRAIIDTLVSRGLRRIVCEGGPSLATQLADAGLIDEFCITITPVISPVDRPFVSPLARLDTEVMGALSDEAGFSYLRLRVRR